MLLNLIFPNTVILTGPLASSFVLIDTGSDSELQQIQDGEIIDLRELQGITLSIKVEFGDANPDAVEFVLNGDEVRTEFEAPFSLGGDDSGDFNSFAELSIPGPYYLEARALSSSGELIKEGSVFFQVINSDLYVKDFVLVDATSNNDLMILPKGKFVLDPALYNTAKLSIRAEVHPVEVGSVQFEVGNSDVGSRIENVSPYSSGGDLNGDYAPDEKLAASGELSLKATPFSNTNASGQPGTALTLIVTVAGTSSVARIANSEDKQLAIFTEVPQKVALAGNYPNPFNPTTALRFGLPEQMNARIVLYDLLGRVVDVVVDGLLSSGWHTVQIDGSNLASGVYIYQLETDNQVLIGQMILQK